MDAILTARKNGATVLLLIDRDNSNSGLARNQAPALARLAARGVCIRNAIGASLGGLYGHNFANKYGHMHAKMVLNGRTLVTGSCNWTKSSTAHLELGVQVTLSREQERYMILTFFRWWDQAEDGAAGETPIRTMSSGYDRPKQRQAGWYGPVAWNSSAQPAPYGHDCGNDPHVPGRLVETSVVSGGLGPAMIAGQSYGSGGTDVVPPSPWVKDTLMAPGRPGSDSWDPPPVREICATVPEELMRTWASRSTEERQSFADGTA